MSAAANDNAKKRATHRSGTLPRIARIAVHALRAALFCAVILLIHAADRERQQRSTANTTVGFNVDNARTLLPEAATLIPIPGSDGQSAVHDDAGEVIGRVLQTSPKSDDIIGFSGPTNVLLAFTPEERLAGIQILSSRDTPEHVDQILQSKAFFDQFPGLSADSATNAQLDGVSGATLTSLAIAESVLRRLGAPSVSLKFPDPPLLTSIRKRLPDAESLVKQPRRQVWWNILNADHQIIGRLIRTSPVADNLIGYQGPTDAYLVLDPDDRVLGVAIGRSYDNEPYVGYVRDDYDLRSLARDRSLAEMANFAAEAAEYEGVSGATMTSRNVVDAIALAAQAATAPPAPEPPPARPFTLRARDLGTMAVVILGVLVSLTRLRGIRWFRVAFQFVLIGYLGFVNGDLLSQAMLVGWARGGIPFDKAAGLVALTTAALLVPLISRSNLYCAQLCPHGAAQQLLKRRVPWQISIPRRLERGLRAAPWLLLLVVVSVAMSGSRFSLVDIEPFDAYIFRVTGVASLTIAIVGLVASLFVPMAYCRFGCPTGALLGFLRFHSRSDQLSLRDLAAGSLLLLAVAIWWSQAAVPTELRTTGAGIPAKHNPEAPND